MCRHVLIEPTPHADFSAHPRSPSASWLAQPLTYEDILPRSASNSDIELVHQLAELPGFPDGIPNPYAALVVSTRSIIRSRIARLFSTNRQPVLELEAQRRQQAWSEFELRLRRQRLQPRESLPRVELLHSDSPTDTAYLLGSESSQSGSTSRYKQWVTDEAWYRLRISRWRSVREASRCSSHDGSFQHFLLHNMNCAISSALS
ncbi:hypothetical protein CC86DRAFT_369258 [Ophiobolus disseminans]|uniref:Uncharacterized protein n=1 Tax=Ophiobolus disseminans TaxID=1469910 RepID=A0A6A7A4Q7_9PLEO|nr:hypothetical protein CC86DRAFT_369258 [Ophiobolus disseminans]